MAKELLTDVTVSDITQSLKRGIDQQTELDVLSASGLLAIYFENPL